jgi:hypothetical protein
VGELVAARADRGLPYPSHRQVLPRGPAARPLPGPTLVEILAHEWRLV